MYFSPSHNSTASAKGHFGTPLRLAKAPFWACSERAVPSATALLRLLLAKFAVFDAKHARNG